MPEHTSYCNTCKRSIHACLQPYATYFNQYILKNVTKNGTFIAVNCQLHYILLCNKVHSSFNYILPMI